MLPSPPCEVDRWFADEVLPHEPALRAYLRGRFPSLADSDDVVQETYIRLLRTHGRRGIRSTRSLLFTTAKHVAIDLFRRRQSAAPIEPLATIEESRVLDEKSIAPDAAARECELDLLEQAIASLPTRCREVILLKKIHGLSYDEISRRLGISPNTISAHLTAGVTRCRDFLKARGVRGTGDERRGSRGLGP